MRAWRGVVILGALVMSATALAQESPSPLPADVEEILNRLEQRKISGLHAKMSWELSFAVEEDEESDRKSGEIWYEDCEPVAKFKVWFRDKIAGNKRLDVDEQFLFDGNWWIEKQSKNTRTITRREVRAADDQRNPYKLGEGAFPVPFGQKKADIVREFEVSRSAPAPDDPPNTDRLRLVPRDGTHTSEQYKTLEFWIAREGPVAGLPLKVRAGKKDGTGKLNQHITIAFSDVELGGGFAGSVFKIETPPGYEEIVEPLAPPAAATPAARPGSR